MNVTGTSRILVYIRTARHLRLPQLVYRPLRKLQAVRPRVPHAREVPDAGRIRSMQRAVLALGPDDIEERIRRARDVVAGRFELLGEVRTLRWPDWRVRYGSYLWSYHLHYFDYALDLAWAYRVTGDPDFLSTLDELLLGWIDGTDPGHGVGWEPYPTSIRIMNWIQLLLVAGDSLAEATRQRVLRSLARQAAFLDSRLEYHIQANHLQRNLSALVFAGLFFGGGLSARWRGRRAGQLWKEVREQVLEDGVHYERSPMYHAVLLGDLLLLLGMIEATGALRVPDAVVQRVRGMVRATGALFRADGRLHLFNDAAEGMAPSRRWLDSAARDVLDEGVAETVGAIVLAEAGYFGFDNGQGDRLLIDCGAPGPDHQPGHAHCDLLSYELDVRGRPFIVDSGTSGYADDPLRSYLRSTRAHNTVVIAGKDQSEVWGSFRMARRARVVDGALEVGNGSYRFRGAYRPYHSRRARHERVIEGFADRWIVTDRVLGAEGSRLESFIHFHPEVEVRLSDGAAVCSVAGESVVIEPFGEDGIVIHRGRRNPDQGWYCPAFGCRMPSTVLELHRESNDGSPFGYVIRRSGAPSVAASPAGGSRR